MYQLSGCFVRINIEKFRKFITELLRLYSTVMWAVNKLPQMNNQVSIHQKHSHVNIRSLNT